MTEWLDGAVRVSALLSLGLLAALALRRQSAALRHWVLAVTVACGLAMPAIAAIVPQWHGPLPWPPSPSVDTAAAPGDGAATEARVAPPGAARAPSLAAVPAPAPQWRIGATVLLWYVWMLGAVASVLILITGLARLRWIAARARAADDPEWQRIGEQLRRHYGLATPVRVLQSDHPALLVTWGWRTPTILLPANAREWRADRIRVVLAHELAHVARGDWAAQLTAEALRAVHWFNPLVWVACRRLRIESECACDDTVLAQGIGAPDYATHLLALARSLQSRRQPTLPAPAMARPSSLEGRIRAMLTDTLNRRAVSSRVRAASAAALLVLAVVVAGLQAQPQLFQVAGTAVDPSGRVLPNARLVLTNNGDLSKFEVRTDAGGRYTFAGVPAAEYTLEASVPGFAPLKDVVRIEGTLERNLMLNVGTLQETITVDARDAPPTTDATVAERRDDARRRAAERAERVKAQCAGGLAPGAAGGNILAPMKLVHVTPTLPEHLRATTTRGTVTMTAVIGTDGLVRDVQNVQGPHADLEAAAVEAVRQWQFSTTFLNCEPIEVQMRVTTNFVAR